MCLNYRIMLEIIIKGIIIGLFISVPLGPIGMLIIQRTLHKGRINGIATGLGATFSDLIYTVVALFFISFVVDFIETHKFIIQTIGSIVVIGFGIFIFRSTPSTQPKVQSGKSVKITKDFISSFILTFSNPLILFILIAIFSRLSFLEGKTTIWEDITGILSILGGAFLWWSILTLLVSKFKFMFNVRRLKYLNQILGIIIILLGIISYFIKL